MRETRYTSIILKKQPFNEADEIITVFTKEKGKLRFLAKSVKFSKSKLSGSLQNLFLVEITAAKSSSHLPKLIGARVLNNFVNLRQDLEKLKYAFYAQELVLKFTGDEHKNEKLFNLFLEYLEFLNNHYQRAVLEPALAKFKIGFLETVGFRITYDKNCASAQSVGFSNPKGGFTSGGHHRGRNLKCSFEQFLKLQNLDFNDLAKASLGEIDELQGILSSFIEYQLERQVKSEKFLLS